MGLHRAEQRIKRSRERSSHVALCSFLGCDDDATQTIGVTSLCALHAGYVTDMLDHRNQPGANLELESFMEQWFFAETHSDLRKLRK